MVRGDVTLVVYLLTMKFECLYVTCDTYTFILVIEYCVWGESNRMNALDVVTGKYMQQAYTMGSLSLASEPEIWHVVDVSAADVVNVGPVEFLVNISYTQPIPIFSFTNAMTFNNVDSILK